MEFEKTIMQHQECFISGIYKIVKYGKWRAYFKPYGWKSWGNTCECTSENRHESKAYKSVKEAIAGCKRHAKKFGENPGEFDTIFVNSY